MQISKWTMVLLGGDLAVFLLAAAGCLLTLREQALLQPYWQYQNLTAVVQLVGLQLLVLYIADLYDQYQDYASSLNISRLIFAVWVAVVLAVLFFRFGAGVYLGRSFIEWQGVSFGVGLVLWRMAFSSLALPTRLRRRLLIIGAGRSGCCLAAEVLSRPNSGLEVAGWVDDDPEKADTTIDGFRVLGNSPELSDLVKKYNIDIVVLAITRDRSPALLTILSRMAYNSVQLMDMPTLYETVAGKIPIDHISEVWLFLHSVGIPKTYYQNFKRLLDLGLAAIGLAVTWPLFLIIGAAIKLDSAGPVFFCQQRLGADNLPFRIFKFRTMYHEEIEPRGSWATLTDPRITRVGRVLRKLRLDELPQLINVLRGEMAFIGPRAEWDLFANDALAPVVKYRPGRRAGDEPGLLVACGREERVPYYGFRSVVRPGITGWAQVMFPMAGSSLAELKEKLQYDLYYIKNMGFLLDMAILLKTIRIVLIGRGK